MKCIIDFLKVTLMTLQLEKSNKEPGASSPLPGSFHTPSVPH